VEKQFSPGFSGVRRFGGESGLSAFFAKKRCCSFPHFLCPREVFVQRGHRKAGPEGVAYHRQDALSVFSLFLRKLYGSVAEFFELRIEIPAVVLLFGRVRVHRKPPFHIKNCIRVHARSIKKSGILSFFEPA
jgi:hypothetical protein